MIYRLLSASLLTTFMLQSTAADWPTTGFDASRGSYTPATLATPLALHWTYRFPHAPMPAWPNSDRQPYDRAYHPVVAGGKVFLGSSADGKVYALDAATGRESWSYFTGGPVRFAPALWKDRLFVVSDDGFLHCLALADGKMLWQKRGGPDGRMILGNDRMISVWPARGGPVVADDTVYFAAGIWPTDGIYLYALDAASGQVRWVNDKSGSIYMAQPHGGANAHSGVAAQGNLVVAGDKLLVPTGRAVPAVFNRADGKFLYFHLQANGHKGGTATLAAGSNFINGGQLFETATGNLLDKVGPGVVAATPDGVVQSTPTDLLFMQLTDKVKVDRKGGNVPFRGLGKVWSSKVEGGAGVIVAGKTAIVGGKDRVTAVDLTSQKVAWSADVAGEAFGLAVSDGRLYVGTDQGLLYCFGAERTAKPAVIGTEVAANPYGENAQAAAAAQEIVDKSGVVDGYCVDLGCGDGALAYELAKRTKLQIYALDADPAKVAEARRKLAAAGVYGVRVTVHQGDPAKSAYPDYFANLVVSGQALTYVTDEAGRLQRPFGGVACLGKPGSMIKSVRGPLTGAGNWTHQYADPANSCCSADIIVKGKLGMLWFRDSDFAMPQRHGRGPAPLYLDGRLFVEGLNGLRAVDAYNGRTLWEYSLPNILKPYDADHLMGTSGTHSNYCVTADGVYLRTDRKCLRLDVATGRKLAEFGVPPIADGKSGAWAFIACEDGILFGSIGNAEHVVRSPYRAGDMRQQHTESKAFFALDGKTGKPLWTYTARDSIRHNAIAIGGGRVYLIDRPLAEGDRLGVPKEKVIPHPKGELLALDARTGKPVWKTAENIFGTLLTLSVKHDVLLMGYQPTSFRLPSERGGEMTAYRASDGQQLWNRAAPYTTRPVINDLTVYATMGKQGGSWNLRTGEEKRFNMNRSYGCGQLAAGAHLMVFRSATLSYFDLSDSDATEDYGGIRPGCWINAIPAGGLVLVPDASAGCQCSYLNQAWIALQGRE